MMGSRIHGNPDCGMRGGIWKTYFSHFTQQKNVLMKSLFACNSSPRSHMQNMEIFASASIILEWPDLLYSFRILLKQTVFCRQQVLGLFGPLY